MKKNIFVLIFCIFTILLSCDNDLTNIKDVVGQYIKKNNLPIAVGKGIIVYYDFNLTDKTNFQVFILDLLDTLASQISEGYYNDQTIENYIELQEILSGFYDYCVNNNYELAIIFKNTENENLLMEYLEYYNFNLTFYNNLVILDNNTHYIDLKNLIGFLLQAGDITRNNLINNFLHDWNGKDAYIYKNILFIDGMIKTTDMEYYANEYFDVIAEIELMYLYYYIIGDIIYLFETRGYNLEAYENIWEEITTKTSDFQRILDNYFNIGQ
jgi:hypothetical protein